MITYDKMGAYPHLYGIATYRFHRGILSLYYILFIVFYFRDWKWFSHYFSFDWNRPCRRPVSVIYIIKWKEFFVFTLHKPWGGGESLFITRESFQSLNKSKCFINLNFYPTFRSKMENEKKMVRYDRSTYHRKHTN